MLGGRAPRKKRDERGLKVEALGQDLARAGQPGGHRLLRRLRPAGRARRARLQPRRLWLHHLHRQFGAAARADRRGDRRGRPRGRGGALGQPQFRGPHPCRRCAPTTSPRRRWSWPMRWPARCARNLANEPLGEGSDGKPVYLKDIWPTQPRDRRHRCAMPYRAMFRAALRQRVRRPAGMAPDQGGRAASPIDFEDCLDLSRAPALFRRTCRRSRRRSTDVVGARELAIFGDSITTDHISPAGSIKTDGPAGRVPDQLSGAPVRVQHLRRAARQPSTS